MEPQDLFPQEIDPEEHEAGFSIRTISDWTSQISTPQLFQVVCLDWPPSRRLVKMWLGLGPGERLGYQLLIFGTDRALPNCSPGWHAGDRHDRCPLGIERSLVETLALFNQPGKQSQRILECAPGESLDVPSDC